MDVAPNDTRSSDESLPQVAPFLTISRKGLIASTTDIIAIGILALALCAGIVAIIISVGWFTGSINGNAASKTILGCVSGSTISGIVSALVSKKPVKPKV
jgi:hypothetical protein